MCLQVLVVGQGDAFPHYLGDYVRSNLESDSGVWHLPGAGGVLLCY